MYDAFHGPRRTSRPTTSVPNEIPLTLGAPGYPSTLTAPPAGATAQERKAFHAAGPGGSGHAERLRGLEAVGEGPGRSTGSMSRADRENPEQLNRLDWYSAHDWKLAYPGDPKIYLPDQVPGRNLPAAFIGNN